MNGIEKEAAGDVDVIRLNLYQPLGKEIASRYDVNSAATTILLDGAGKVVYRHTGMPNRKKIMAELTAS